MNHELLVCGMTKSKLDAAVFYYHENNVLIGIFISHVDDFLYAGTSSFETKVVDRIRATFIIGAEEVAVMDYLGLNIHQYGFDICLSMSKYIDSIDDIKISPSHRSNKKMLCCLMNIKCFVLLLVSYSN